MKLKPIVIVHGEPKSIFLEIFFKSLKKNYKSPIVLISSLNLVNSYIRKFNIKKKINIIEIKSINLKKLNNKEVNLINIPFKNIKNSNKFIKESFKIGLKLINSNYTYKFINGPISKKKFLNKRYPGVTEFLAEKSFAKSSAMLIFNKNLSVCPLTTHLPIKNVQKKITSKNIKEKVTLIRSFYKNYIGKNPKIGVLGLNPHCESTDKFNEDERIIRPSIKYLRKLKFRVSGPFSADTIFMKQNRTKFDVILGMYHDQVLTPIKTIYEYNAINITLGLPFLRISPDHGPNEKMIGKNLSNPFSLVQAIKFLDKH